MDPEDIGSWRKLSILIHTRFRSARPAGRGPRAAIDATAAGRERAGRRGGYGDHGQARAARAARVEHTEHYHPAFRMAKTRRFPLFFSTCLRPRVHAHARACEPPPPRSAEARSAAGFSPVPGDSNQTPQGALPRNSRSGPIRHIQKNCKHYPLTNHSSIDSRACQILQSCFTCPFAIRFRR